MTRKEFAKKVDLLGVHFRLVLGASVEMFLDKARGLVGIRVGMFAVPFAELANDVCCPFSRINGFMDFFPVDRGLLRFTGKTKANLLFLFEVSLVTKGWYYQLNFDKIKTEFCIFDNPKFDNLRRAGLHDKWFPIQGSWWVDIDIDGLRCTAGCGCRGCWIQVRRQIESSLRGG